MIYLFPKTRTRNRRRRFSILGLCSLPRHLRIGFKAALISHQRMYPHIMFSRGFCVWSSHLLLFLASLTFAKADYYIDDSNGSVIYTQSQTTNPSMWYSSSETNPSGITFSGNNSAETIDFSRLYNNTL